MNKPASLVPLLLAGAAALALPPLAAQAPRGAAYPPSVPAQGSDIPATYAAPEAGYDYVKRTVEIPMRDGVKLHTVIVIPKGAARAPMILTRTPYNADKRAQRSDSGSMLAILPQGDEVFVRAGYIRVFQDIRGKYGSEGDYEMTRPVIGPLNHSTTDHVTDAYDTIDWLVKNVPESNGKVGMLGSSYEGFTVVMALLGPHPALKVAAPESPMVNGWMGDDFFHYGAYRMSNDAYFVGQESGRKGEAKLVTSNADDYDAMLRAGSAGDFGRLHALDQFGMYRRVVEHPTYDAYWQGQALEDLLVKRPSTVPTLWEQGLWDQEDMWGAIHSFEALQAAGHGATNFLVMGPWRHSQFNYDGSSLGAFKWAGDTAGDFRRDVLLPFFNSYLLDGAPHFDPPKATIYNTGENHWDRFASWPPACPSGCATAAKPLYLTGGFGLSFDKPAGTGGDSYVSDPAKPIPYVPRPVGSVPGQWQTWLVSDQRPAATRPDVLTYQTDKLTRPVRISGQVWADLFARTTGTDADWVVKLIDVYPDEMPSQPELGGYQLAVSLDIFRGRYRQSFEHPSAIPAGKVQEYRFRLPTANHVFLPGHRIMVQVQSSLFPVYDRNPQTYVPNIFNARPGDYKAQTMTVMRAGAQASAVWLPVVDAGGGPTAEAAR